MTRTGISSIGSDLSKRWSHGCILQQRRTSSVGVCIGSDRSGGRSQSCSSIVVVSYSGSCSGCRRRWMNAVTVRIMNGSMRGVGMRVGMSKRMRMRSQWMAQRWVVVTVRVSVMVVVVVWAQIGAIRQTEEVGQILPSMLHAHRAHQRHAHLQKEKENKQTIRSLIFQFHINREKIV